VIEKKMFSNTEELLPVISFNAKASADEAKKHEDFVTRMVAKGYTPKQVRLLCEWYLRVRKSSDGWPPHQGGLTARIGGIALAASSIAGWPARTSPSATASASCAATRSRSARRCKRAVDGRGIRDIEQGETSTSRADISEPVFHHGQGGVRDMVHPGNQEYVRGDRIERPQGGRQGSGQGQASDSGEGEDDFVFT
jgi:hypothetical protein